MSVTLSAERLRALFAHHNVKAFYAVVRRGESSLDERAYRMISGGGEFFDFSRHPYAGLSTKQGGKAAGAPQFIPSTWAEVAELYSLPDFSADSQDMGYVARLVYRKAIEPLMAGDFAEAIRRCKLEWTSLPGASENNPKWNYAAALALYLQHGGTLGQSDSKAVVVNEVDNQPAAPIEDRSVQMEQPAASSFDWGAVLQVGGAIASAFNPLIGVAISALGPIVQQKIEKEVGRHTDPATAKTVAAQLSTSISDAVTKATGKADPIAAVAELRSNPVAVAAVEAAVTTRLAEIGELVEVGGGIVEARKAGADPAALPAWRQGPFWISLILLLVGGAIVGSVLWGAGWRPEDKSQVLMLAVSLFSMTGGFWLGSSIGSSRKTDMFNNARAP